MVQTVSARSSPKDRLALFSLAVAALATIASVAQSVLAYRSVDAPYVALVYQEQVRRTVETVDFIAALKADVERWEAIRGSGAMDSGSVLPQVRDRMQRFAKLSQAAWLLTPASQVAVGKAASAFNTFAVTCLIPRYADAGAALPEKCGPLFEAHETTARAASDAILSDIRFDNRRARSK